MDSRKVSQDSAMNTTRQHHLSWRVGGLSLGLSEQEVVLQKGAPSEYQGSSTMSYGGKNGLITVVLDEKRLVRALWGLSLAGPSAEVSYGDSIEKAKSTLGYPDVIEESNLTYYRNGMRIDIGHNNADDTISTICLRALDKRERAILYAQRGYADW